MVKFGSPDPPAAASDKVEEDLVEDAGILDMSKPEWVDLAGLKDLPEDPALWNRLLYKPALRFHGGTDGTSSPQLGATRLGSLTSTSLPKYKDLFGGASTYDQSSLYNTTMSVMSSNKSRRRRNTMAVILIVIALLAAIGAVIGVTLQLLSPRDMLRANVYMTIANRNFTDNMLNKSSSEFEDVAEPLCREMNRFYLSSKVEDYYLRCNVVSLSLSKNNITKGLDVHFTLDFIDNSVTDDADTIKDIILRKSGRHTSNNILFLVVRDFLIYLKSLRVQLERLPMPGNIPRPSMPWDDDDFPGRNPSFWYIDSYHLPVVNASDLEEMKLILKTVYNSLEEMKQKMDLMHSVLAVINDTEGKHMVARQPEQLLIEILQNMTTSLENLNGNLNNINSTFGNIKFFLKKLNTSFLNIDDTVQYLENTVSSLDGSVLHLTDSISNMNGVIFSMTNSLLDINGTLQSMDKTLKNINDSSWYTDITLDNMKDTIYSVDRIIFDMTNKLRFVNNSFDGLSISLNNINGTVRGTYDRLADLGDNVHTINSTALSINNTITKLRVTFNRINKTINSMNETFSHINGTSLDVIGELFRMNATIVYVNDTIVGVTDSMDTMNKSISLTLDWLAEMMTSLKQFADIIESADGKTTVFLQNGSMHGALHTLLQLNETLISISDNITHVNNQLNKMENRIGKLDGKLQNVESTLQTINMTFRSLNRSLGNLNLTIGKVNATADGLGATMKNVKETLLHLDSSYKNINNSLETVNKTLFKVNSTLNNLSLNLSNMNLTINRIDSRLKQDNLSLYQLTSSIRQPKNGSLRDINNTLHTANETLHLFREKANIIGNLHRPLSEGIFQLQESVNGLEDRLKNINKTLVDTSYNLDGLSTSTNNISKTLKDMEAIVQHTQVIFQNAYKDFTNFTDAFPNISALLKELNFTLSVITDKHGDSNEKIKDNILVKEELERKLFQLQHFFRNVSNLIKKTNNSLEQVREQSTILDLSLKSHTDNIANNQAVLDTDRVKVEFLSNVLPDIKQTDADVSREVKVIKEEIGNIKSSLAKVSNMLNASQERLTKYPNLVSPAPELLKQVVTIRHKLDQIDLELKKNSEEHLLLKWSVWDAEGNPVAFDDSIGQIRSRVDTYTDLLVDTKDFTTNASSELGKVKKSLLDIRSTVDEIDSTVDKVRDIDSGMSSLHEKIEKTRESLSEKNKTVQKLFDDIWNVYEVIGLIKDDYGDINGTFNQSSLYYEELENTLMEMNKSLDEIRHRYLDTYSKFKTVASNFEEENDTYRNAVISMNNTDYLTHLDDTMSSTNTSLTEINLEIGNISSKAKLLKNSIRTITFEVDEIENKLLGKKRTYNYVLNTLPPLEKLFDKVKQKFEDITSTLHLASENRSVADRQVEVLNQKLLLFKRVNISLEQQLHGLEEVGISLNNTDNELKKLLLEYNELRGKHDKVDEKKDDLQAIKSNFTKFDKSLNGLFSSLVRMEESLSDVSEATDGIRQDVDNINSKLDLYADTGIKVSKLKKDWSILSDNQEQTEKILKEALSNITKLFQELKEINSENTNISVHSVSASHNFIKGELEEANSTLQYLQEGFQSWKKNYSQSEEMFENMNSSFENTIVNRANLLGTMLDVLYRWESLEEFVNYSQSVLEGIRDELSTVKLTLWDVNETMHATNLTLFLEKQKKLYVDKNIPSLQKKYRDWNKSVNLIKFLIEELESKLGITQRKEQMLGDLLKKYPSLNISLADKKNRIKDMNKTLEELASLHEFLTDKLLNLNESLRNHYLQNETLDDIKSRFKDVNKSLNDINTRFKELRIAMDDVNTIRSMVESNLNKTESAVEGFARVQKDFENLGTNIEVISNRSVSAKRALTEVTKDSSYLEEALKKLKERFKGINETIYNESIFHDDALHKDILERISRIQNTSNKVSAMIEVIGKRYEQTNEKLYNKTLSTDDLEEKIVDVTRSQRALNDAVLEAHESIDQILEETDVVRNSLRNLNSSLHNTEEKLQKQEIREFITEHLPNLENKYKKAESGLHEMNDNVRLLIRESKDLLSNMKEVDQKMNVMIPIDIPLDPMETKLKIVINLNSDLADQIRKTNNTLKEVKTSVWPEKNRSYLDTEMLSDIKKRYDHANITLSNVIRTVEKLQESSNFGRDSMFNISTALVEMNAALNSTSDLLTESDRKRSLLDLKNTLIQNSSQTLNQLNDRIKNYTNIFSSLNELYKNVKSSTIHDISKGLNDGLLDLEQTITIATQQQDEMETLYHNASNTIADVLSILQTNSTSLGNLQAKLKLSKVLLSAIDPSVQAINKYHVQINSTISPTVESLDEIEDQLQNYEVMLKNQQKYDFIEQQIPGLQKMYLDLEKSFIVANETLLRAFSYINSTEEGLDLLKDRVTRYHAINTSFADLDTDVNSVKLKISEMTNVYKDSLHTFDTLDETMLNASTPFFVNATLEDIKLAFEDFSKDIDSALSGLIYVNETAVVVDNNTHSTATSVKEGNEILDLLDQTLSTLVKVAEHADQIDNPLRNTNKLLRNASQLIVESSQVQEQLSKHYKDINNTNLQKRLRSAKASLQQVSKKAASLDDVVPRLVTKLDEVLVLHGDIMQTLAAPVSDFVSLNNILQDVSNQVTDLNNSTNFVNLTLRDIEGDVIELYRNSSSIQEEGKKLEKLFKETEKLKFIEATVPSLEDIYNSVENTMIFLAVKLNDTKTDANSFTADLPSLSAKLSSYRQFNVTPDSLFNSMEVIDDNLLDTARNHSWSSELFGTLNNSLLDKSGKQFSEDLTLNGIMFALNKFNSTLSSIRNALFGVDLSINNTALLLDSVRNKKSTFVDVLKDFDNVTKRHDYLSRKIDQLKAKRKESNGNYKFTNKTLDDVAKKTNYMFERFPHVESSELHERLAQLANNVRLQTEKNVLISDKLVSTSAILGKLDSDDIYIKNKLQSTFHSLEDINKTSHETAKKLPSLEAESQKVDFMLANASSYLTNISREATYLEDEANHVEQLFVEKEKQDYIEHVVPILQAQYKTVREALSSVYIRLNDTKLKTDDAIIDVAILLERLSAYPHVHISTKNLSELMNNTSNDLINGKASYDTAVDTFSTLNSSLLDPTGRQFDNNASFNYIKSVLDDFNKSLSAVTQTLHEVELLRDSAGRSINSVDTATQDINNVLNRFDDVSKDQIRSLKKINELKEELNKSSTIQRQSSDILLEAIEKQGRLSERFKDVTDPALQAQLINAKKRADLLNATDLLVFDDIQALSHNLEHLVSNINSNKAELQTQMYDIKDLNKTVDKVQRNFQTVEDILVTGENASESIYNRSRKALNSTSALKNDLDILEQFLLNRQKVVYVQSTFPKMRERYVNISKSINLANQSLAEVSEYSNRVERDIAEIKHRIGSSRNIDVTLSHELNEVNKIITESTGMATKLKSLKSAFSTVDEKLIDENHVLIETNLTLKEIKNIVKVIDNLFDSVSAGSEYIHNSSSNMNQGISRVDKHVLDVNETIDKLASIQQEAIEKRDTIDEINQYLDETAEHLQLENTSIQNLRERLMDIRSKYVDVNNSNIHLWNTVADDTFNKVKNELDDLDKVFEPLDKEALSALKSQIDVHMNKTYTTLPWLKMAINEMKGINANITREVQMTTSFLRKINSAIPTVSQSVAEIEDVLSELEHQYELQAKKDFIGKNVPNIKLRYDNLEDDIKAANKSLSETQNIIDDVQMSSIKLRDRMLEIPNINIGQVEENTLLKRLDNESETLSTWLEKITNTVQSLDKSFIEANGTNVNLNNTFDKIRQSLDSTNFTLTAAKNDLFTVNRQRAAVDLSVEYIKDALKKTNSLADRYEILVNYTETFIKDKNVINTTLSSIAKELSSRKENIKKMNASLAAMRHQYDDIEASIVNDTTSTIEEQILFGLEKVDAFSKLLADISERFNLTGEDLTKLVGNTTNDINSVNELEATIIYSERKFPIINSSFTSIKQSLVEIKDNLPELGATVHDIADTMDKANETLHQEKVKLKYTEATLPGLKEKQESINVSFVNANRTLMVMNKTLRQIEGYVENIKKKIQMFPSINISLSDMDDNLTKIEENLDNMKVQYNYIRKTIETLKKDMMSPDDSLFGGNVTFDELKEKYNYFDTKLDTVKFILNKMNDEFQVMDSEFTSMNDSLWQMDEGIDHFNATELKIKQMKPELKELEKSMKKTEETVNGLVSEINFLNKTYTNIQQLYESVADDVFTTDQLNVQSMIDDVGIVLPELQDSIKYLKESFEMSKADFEEMNSVLHNTTHSVPQLTSVLENVNQRYNDIKGNLSTLQQSLNKENNVSASLTHTLEDLHKSLAEIGATLSKEQEKFDYMEERLTPLQSEFVGLQKPISDTNITIKSAKRNLESVNQKLENVNTKLESVPTANISTDVHSASVSDMETIAAELAKEYRDMTEAYTTLGNSMKELEDRNGSLADIKEKYEKVNDTLAEFRNNLSRFDEILSDVLHSTGTIDGKVTNLDSNLDKYVLLSENVRNLENKLEESKSLRGDTTTSVRMTNDTLNTISSDLDDIFSNYAVLNSSLLENVGNELRKDVVEYGDKIESLSTKLDGADADIKRAQVKFLALNGTINSVVNTNEDLNRTLSSVNALIEQVKPTVEELRSHLRDVHMDAEGLTVNASKAANAVKQLNASLASELDKYKYINKTWPTVREAYTNLNKSLRESEDNIDAINVHRRDIETFLNQLNGRISRLPTVNIPLTQELEMLQKVNRTLLNLEGELSRNREVYSKLNLTTLKENDGHLSGLQLKYKSFNDTINKMNAHIKSIETELGVINNQLIAKNKTFIETNTTLNQFEDTEKKIKETTEDMESLSEPMKEIVQSMLNEKAKSSEFNDKFTNLNNVYKGIENDDIIVLKDLLDKDLKKVNNSLRNLSYNLDTLRGTFGDSEKEYLLINDTFFNKINSIDEMQAMLISVDKEFDVMLQQLEGLHGNLSQAHSKQTNIDTHLGEVLDRLKQLQSALEKEMAKKNYIDSNLPDTLKRYNEFNNTLSGTIQELISSEKELRRVNNTLQTLENRIKDIETLNLSQKAEQKALKYLDNVLNELNKKTDNFSNTYNSLSNALETLSSRNGTLDDVKSRFSTLENSLTTLGNEVFQAENSLSKLAEEVTAVGMNLTNRNATINEYEKLRKKFITIGGKISIMNNNLLDTNHSLQAIADNHQIATSSVNDLMNTYNVLNDSRLRDRRPTLERKLDSVEKGLTSWNTKLNTLIETFRNSQNKYKNINKTLESVQITNDNFHEVLNSTKNAQIHLEMALKSANKSVGGVMLEAKKGSSLLKTLEEDIHELNVELSSELEKYKYVNATAPRLQIKYSQINKMHNGTLPTILGMKEKIDHAKNVFESINTKLKQFKLDPNDYDVVFLEDSLKEMKDNLIQMEQKYKNNTKNLHNLKSELWKDTLDAFTEKESLQEVKSRFAEYNSTLDEIDTSVNDVTSILTSLGTNLTNVELRAEKLDTALSSPPKWLSFSGGSAEVTTGTVTLHCKAAEFDQWRVMLIQQKRTDGKLVRIASWNHSGRARKLKRDSSLRVAARKTSAGASLFVRYQPVSCENEGEYRCLVDSHKMWPIKTTVNVTSPPVDDVHMRSPTEVFTPITANFTCVGKPGYPNGSLKLRVKKKGESQFHDQTFYSLRRSVDTANCIRTETLTFGEKFDMSWNETKIRCEVQGKEDYFAEAAVLILPENICANVPLNGRSRHPYTPHKYLICQSQTPKIMDCPGKTCFDESNPDVTCKRCTGNEAGVDPCVNKQFMNTAAFPGNCKKYYICKGYTKEEKKCPNGFYSGISKSLVRACVLNYKQSYCSKRGITRS